jgi:hypothetical protein
MSHFCSRLRTVWPIEAHDSGHDDNRPRARDSEPKGTRSGLVHPVVPPYSPGYSASTRMWVRARHTPARPATPCAGFWLPRTPPKQSFFLVWKDVCAPAWPIRGLSLSCEGAAGRLPGVDWLLVKPRRSS